jgi:hypothetical protein
VSRFEGLTDDVPRLVPAQQAAEILGIAMLALRRRIQKALRNPLNASSTQSGRVLMHRNDLAPLLYGTAGTGSRGAR